MLISHEPFLIVDLIASIRRVLAITLRFSEIMHRAMTDEKKVLVQASMIELGGLIPVMMISIFLLHRATGDGKPAGEEGWTRAVS